MTHSAVLLTLDALATFRLTRLVTQDTITEPVRDRVGRPWKVIEHRGGFVSSGRKRSGLRYQLSVLVGCPWCASPYLAGLVVCCQALVPGVWLYVGAVLAFSGAAGFLAERT